MSQQQQNQQPTVVDRTQSATNSIANGVVAANLPYQPPPIIATTSRQDASPRSRKLVASPPPSHPAPPTYTYDPTQSPLQPLHTTQPAYQTSYSYGSQYPSQYSTPTPSYAVVNSGSGQLTSPTPPQIPGSTSQQEPQKRSRLARACDQCSERKVKCDALGPPCKPCKDLALPCTNNRETKRRGPRNRLAEEYHKSKRLKEEQDAAAGNSISPIERREGAEVLAYMPSQARRHDSIYHAGAARTDTAYSNGYAHSPWNAPYYDHGVNIDRLLCPSVILDLLVDDFFMYIHPVAPFPHEPTFRQGYREQRHLKDHQFLALLASMIGSLVASFPRKPQEHLKAKGLQAEFAKSLDFVNRCHKTATDARGPGYLDNNLSIYDGVTSYFLGLAAAYTFDWRRTRLYFSETLGILRTLGVHRAYVPHGGFGTGASDPVGSVDHTEIDYIQQQIGRRLFWCMLVGVRSLQQLGATFGELFVPPPTATDPYPPLPEDVDDDYISNTHIEKQPRGNVSRMAGFIVNIKIYSSLTKIATMEIAYGTDQVYDWPRQKQILNDCYEMVERATDYMPVELILKPGANVGEFASIPAPHRALVGYPDGRLNGVGMGHFGGGVELSPRRKIQFEIQKANIYASQLGTRSYVVEKFWNLQDAYDKMNPIPSATLHTAAYSDGHTSTYPHAPPLRRKRLEDRVAQERENIVKDLLKVLCSISRVNMEPNGGSFVNKVRQIASTLIGTNDARKGPVAHQAQEFLGNLLDILVVLERTGPASPGNVVDTADGGRKQMISEEEELNMWADLREVQMAFLSRGGFMAAT